LSKVHSIQLRHYSTCYQSTFCKLLHLRRIDFDALVVGRLLSLLNSLISLAWVISLTVLIRMSRLSSLARLICWGLWVSLSMLRRLTMRNCLAMGSRTMISIMGCLVPRMMLRGILSPRWRLPMRILLCLSRACRHSPLIHWLLLLLLLMLLLGLMEFVISLVSDMHVVGTTVMLLRPVMMLRRLLLWLVLGIWIGLIGLIKQRSRIQPSTIPLV